MSMAATLPRRLGEAERRDTLVTAAEAIFLAQGYAAASMDDVAQAAGMSKKTLYQVFASKEALFEAVVQRFCAPILDAADPGPGDGRVALERLLEEIAHHILAPRSVALFRVIAAEVRRAPELAAAVQRSRGRTATALQDWLLAQAAAGRLRIGDAEQVAGMLIGMMVGEPHVLMLLDQGEAPGPAEIAERGAADRGGCSSAPPPSAMPRGPQPGNVTRPRAFAPAAATEGTPACRPPTTAWPIPRASPSMATRWMSARRCGRM